MGYGTYYGWYMRMSFSAPNKTSTIIMDPWFSICVWCLRPDCVEVIIFASVELCSSEKGDAILCARVSYAVQWKKEAKSKAHITLWKIRNISLPFWESGMCVTCARRNYEAGSGQE
ncbi:hypothetical protein Mp_5g20890 [Marchantia polymorpha subsp. ruderalis]|uniref:Uncharacterized protein n=2 Tax=Marchantia polymorpha TaxID=3197 RepID=A0AAF6BKJ4_MARPO|nr:hypothetical protein MARPO_0058s0069 [Marchantia polymorpha]BBN12528.1 hypothetical protein Mp_5g20890 [Marchantia polymorpha subsp. ruderalis]|eukprot:PTQ37282.1 hypothetical protein MARPO_0058s0069 [Marchantia polymorpha]